MLNDPATRSKGIAMMIVRLVLVLTCGLGSVGLQAEDWPQWMGKKRNNQLDSTGLVESFSKEQLPPVWKADIGGGYAGPAAADGRVFVTDYVTKNDVTVANFERKQFSGIERVLCFDAASGKPIWKHEYPVNYTVSYPAGPRCTPTVDAGLVYTLGTEGNLFCFAVDSGKIIWSRNLIKDFGTKTALWGYASHPLIDGNKLICVVGGKGSHMVAFNKLTGEEIWRQGTSTEQGYVPPTIVEGGGTRQLIAGRPDAIASLNPETGDEYWSIPYEASNGSIIMSPMKIVVEGVDYLFIGGYDKKNVMMRMNPSEPKVEILWQDENRLGLSPVNVQPIVIGDIMYGFDGGGQLRAFRIPSGERLWETSQPLGERPLGTGTAFIVQLDESNRVLMFSEQGDLIIAKLTREGFSEIDRAKVIAPTGLAFGRKVVWSAPAYADGRMYVRNDREIRCVNLIAN